jgi:hypothetical protein
MTPPTQPTPDDEISLLDILVVLAENFWLLVLAPLAIGAITFGIVSFQPKTYESVFILRPQTVFDEFGNAQGETAALMVARLDSPKLRISAAATQAWIRDRKLEDSQLVSFVQDAASVTADRQSNLVTLRTFAPSPGDAESLGSALIDSYVQDALPHGTARETILNNIKVAQNALSVLNPAIDVLLSVDEATGKVETDLASQAASRPALADLVAQRTASENQITALNNSLKITMQDIVIQAPMLNEKAVKPKRLQLTAMAVILSGLILTVFVFLRAALRSAAHNPEGSDKVARIRRGILRR